MQTSTTNIPEGLKENNISKESMTHGDLRNESNSAKIFSSTKQNSDTSTPEEIRPIQSSDTCTTTSITQSLTTSTHEDTIKNLELNLVHSELSNDIFASLQVPPGCQNPESTSPTAAFLLAFPLVSSVKVTEIIDEDNSESQRGTPTLLQIGTIDSTKSTHTDTLAGGLLAFDSFFNNKDVCSSFYNSYPGEVKKAFECKQSNSSVEMTNASSRVCEEVKVDEKVQAPKNKSLEVMYHSKMPREYTKLAESANDKKLDDKFKMIAGDTFNEPILTSAATNSDKKDTKKNYHKIFNENPADQNIGDGKEKNLNTKIMDDNNCRKKLVLESTDDNTVKQETFKQNVEEKNNIQTFQGTSHEILKCQMKIGNNITVKKNQKDVFDNDLKVICDSFPSNGVSNIHHIPQENENKLPKEITGNFNKPSMNVYVSAPNTNSFKTALTTPTSGTVGKIHEKGCANSSNEISHLYERKVVSSNFPNIYHNSKDNRNINFNLNYTNNTTPLLEKNPTRNCEGSVSANINYNIGLTNIPKDTPSNRKYTTERVTDLRGVDSNINSKITIDQLQRNSKQPENINYNMFEVTHTGMLKDVPVTISNNIGQIRSIDSNISLKANDHQQRHASKKTDVPIFEVTGGSEKCAHLKSINSNINSETTVGHRQQYNSKKQDVHHNIFELATNVPKEIPVSMGNGTEKTLNIKISDSSKATADVPPQGSTKKSGDIYLKSSGQKSQCYFSTSYSDASCSFNHRTDSTRIYPTGSYMNLNKSCPNPLYTNCTNYNYSYPETTFQNYYTPAISRSETKSHYSLSYENYQEHKRVDTSTFASKCYGNTSNYIKDGKTPSDKDKCLGQSKTVNWMTTPDNKIQPPEPFLPAFTNQSYSFASCNTGETVESGIIEPKKSTDLPLVPEEKQFSWSPTKLPNFLDTTPNFVTPTLPTLVGDLALGNPLTFSEQKPECKYPKEAKRKNVAYENQGNFLSVSQLVDHNKTERVTTRRNSGNRSKNTMHMKNKKSPKNDHDKVSQVKSTPNNYNMLGINDMFYDQKNRNSTKASSSYSAEALIGNQVPETSKKYSSNSIKQVGSSNFLTENIINYFPPVEDNYVTQNPSNIHHSFQNNAYNVNTFVYTTPVVSTTQVSSNFEMGHEYAQDHFGALGNAALKDKTKNYRPSNNKDDKNVNYADNMKRPRKKQTYESNNINFEYPLLSMPGSTNSPILPDDFHSHTNFLPPTTPYSSKNSLYQRQGNEFNANPLLSLTGLPRNNSQHPDTSSLMNPVGTSLTNFNLSTIFPEINKGATSNIYPDNRNKEHSGSQQGSFNIDQKYTFPG
ncbi:hypothetical protein JTB14_027794 [Gonioctena quinquepunctata]|nr:hypothetical protein JTB14_027794 [Gonioctena quinquepunctata]